MRKDAKAAIFGFLFGAGSTVASMALPQAYPHWPIWVWQLLSWSGIAVMVISGIVLGYEFGLRPWLRGKRSPMAPVPPTGPTIQFQYTNAFLPSAIPPTGRVLAFELSPGVNDQVGHTTERYGEPGTPVPWFQDGQPSGVYRCELTNFGTIPLFGASIDLAVSFGERVINPNPIPDEHGATFLEWEGKQVARGHLPVKVARLDPGADKSFVFYLYNKSPHYARATPAQTVQFALDASNEMHSTQPILPEWPFMSFSHWVG
jgi:hypothetical protein